MPVETKVNVLKRCYPGEENDQHRIQTEQMLTNVITVLESQKDNQGSGLGGNKASLASEQGAVPPPNTPCTKD